MFYSKCLVIIAGTSAVGKSTFMEQVRKGKYPDLLGQLGCESNKPWKHLGFFLIEKYSGVKLDGVILHYDMYGYSRFSRQCSSLQGVIEKAEKVVVVTLCASSSVLARRAMVRLVKENIRFPLSRKRQKKKMLEKFIDYFNSFTLYDLYEDWLGYITNISSEKHILVDTSRRKIVLYDCVEKKCVETILQGSLHNPVRVKVLKKIFSKLSWRIKM